ncbi:flavodoxin [Alkalibaculum sp. M08DMB]|uniref:Flavodoxin n=1 Tax=Alkalibaculum sporogenes TaxID=2655001 RepID=A0A6A7K9H7_9FIRM|nr:flavodoxin [Alkalibaculum sporogenes]MPW26100.1 flavodoxin [Alkalibaculum sporogenes]
MKKISIVYWSGTGNTELMAKAIEEGLEDVQVELLSVDKASITSVVESDGIALGCPSMGAEILEEDEMEPFVVELEKENIKGKAMILFGSYGWGDGEWMQDWEKRMKDAGVNLIEDGFIIQEDTIDERLPECKELAMRLANFINNN